MELKGKKIAFLGDSITEGYGTTGEDATFWRILGRETGAQVFGYGIGGTRIAPLLNPAADDPAMWGKDFCTRVDTMIPDADIVVVFGGTNDFGHGDVPFGDQTDREPTTFCGAAHTLCRKLLERYPAGQIVIMTPTHRLDEQDRGLNAFGIRRCGILIDYVRAIRETAEYYSIPVLDLYRVSGIQPAVEEMKVRYMPDGLHPNDAGHVKIAEKLIGFLKSL